MWKWKGHVMSEIGWYKSDIKLSDVTTHRSNIESHPCFEILKRSLEAVAKEHKGNLTKYVTSYGGDKTPCDLAMSTPEFSRGVGIKIDTNTGEVNFLYDSYGGHEKLVQDITNEISQNYIAIALIRVMKSHGYHVNQERSEQPTSVKLVGVA